MLPCYNCKNGPNKESCSTCRDVLKHDLAKRVLSMNRVYLDETNRNKNGRPSKVKDLRVRYDIYNRYKELNSYRKVAKEFNVSKSSVQNAIKDYEKAIKDHREKNS